MIRRKMMTGRKQFIKVKNKDSNEMEVVVDQEHDRDTEGDTNLCIQRHDYNPSFPRALQGMAYLPHRVLGYRTLSFVFSYPFHRSQSNHSNPSIFPNHHSLNIRNINHILHVCKIKF